MNRRPARRGRECRRRRGAAREDRRSRATSRRRPATCARSVVVAARKRSPSSARFCSVMSRKTTVNSMPSGTTSLEIDASAGNSVPSLRRPKISRRSPMRRAVTRRCAKRSRCAVMRLAKARRQQNVEMPSDGFVRAVAEDLLGAVIEVDDLLRVVDRDDRVGGDGEDAGELRLRRPQLLLDPALLPEARANVRLLNRQQRQCHAGDHPRDQQTHTSEEFPASARAGRSRNDAPAQLLLNALLVRVHGFRADEQPLPDLRRRKPCATTAGRRARAG